MEQLELLKKALLAIGKFVYDHFTYKGDEPLPLHNEPMAFPPEESQIDHPEPIASADWLDKLIVGLMYAESRSAKYPNGGDPDLIGDKGIPEKDGGPAYGCLQIRGGVRSEVNDLLGTAYVGKDLLGKKGAELSKKMCRTYMLEILPKYKSYKAAIKAGVPLNEVCAKSWNGGPGYFLAGKKLNAYWHTVKTHMPK